MMRRRSASRRSIPLRVSNATPQSRATPVITCSTLPLACRQTTNGFVERNPRNCCRLRGIPVTGSILGMVPEEPIRRRNHRQGASVLVTAVDKAHSRPRFCRLPKPLEAKGFTEQ
jgi:hypothetical protein